MIDRDDPIEYKKLKEGIERNKAAEKKLLPCPFCGKKMKLVIPFYFNADNCLKSCRIEHVEISSCIFNTEYHYIREELLEKWNNRCQAE